MMHQQHQQGASPGRRTWIRMIVVAAAVALVVAVLWLGAPVWILLIGAMFVMHFMHMFGHGHGHNHGDHGSGGEGREGEPGGHDQRPHRHHGC